MLKCLRVEIKKAQKYKTQKFNVLLLCLVGVIFITVTIYFNLMRDQS